jgi:hypothetical protein
MSVRPSRPGADVCAAALSRLESKFLNNRIESREPRSVTNLRALPKIFTNSLRWIAAKPIFRSAWRRYGDKWLVTRRFSRFFFRVTPPLAFRDQNQTQSISMGSRTRLTRTRNVSGAAELHQVKIRGAKEFISSNPCRTTRAKNKKARHCRAFDEYLFRSVHFASFAI